MSVNFNLEMLEYRILTHDSVGDASLVSLHSKAYEFWKSTWKKIFTDIGSPEIWSGDDYFRQTYIPVITYNDEVVALHCSTIFWMQNPCLRDLKYFSAFNKNVTDWIEENNLNNFMSMEFLSVHKNWRFKESGFSFAEILIGLASKLLELKKYEAALGISVKAAKITEKSQKLNYSLLTEEAFRGNLICDVIGLLPSDHVHPDAATREVIDYLWKNKINSKNNENNFLIAA